MSARRHSCSNTAGMAKQQSVHIAGLRHVTDERTPGIRRLGSPTTFRYVRPNGRPISAAAELARIKALVIPPAWTDVWICPGVMIMTTSFVATLCSQK